MLEKLFIKNLNYYRVYRKLKQNKLAVFGIVFLLLLIFTALFYPLITPYPFDLTDFNASYQPPSVTHLLGTDELGRDLFSRILYGSQITILVGVGAVVIAMIMGVALGLLAGYFRGRIDAVITSILDAIWAFPTLILALAITAILGPGLRNVIIAIGIVYTPGFARVVRSMVLSVREMEYIQGAKSIGLSSFKIIWRYVIPNISSVIIVQVSLNAAQAIIAEASLSFLGLGVQAPAASWGSLLKTGYQYIHIAPWLSVFPGLCIMLTVLALNFLGDGLRDALDVKIKMD